MLFVLSLGIGLVCGSLFLGIVLLIDRYTRPHNTRQETRLTSWN
ncbi:hypothetical protein [Deinococcus cellulosilyticus]|uniref:Uncharacterized protein n=1 Tax=Deinococcus cellulosilyticus (strain DSM 18568 / NBRC 106333 / KACC 11606 / 5516J-15) TaxID=1223518 RepID=A0A511NAS1_DEIC1|nr:hypothetical protein [Deinococcus cellulosilyticus]GEM49598.1 hypothetical protein DC3_52330 [Deinococcus cellulosilyticus NBRC 106333 = KACC 11606]